MSDVEHPSNCPSCDCKLTIESGGKDTYELMCKNTHCPAQNISGLCHYLKTFEVLGLGESKVTSLVEGGAVKKFSDFYKLEVSDVVACGLSERQALLVLAGIHMITSPDKYDDAALAKKIITARKTKKNIPLWRLFASFGIEAAGKSAGKALVDHFGSFDGIRKATVDELTAVANVGEKTAQIVFDYLKDNSNEIDALLNFVEPELPKTGPLTGQSFVLTGGFDDGGKMYWEKKIEEQGGKCGSSVSKTTNYVVVGTNAGSKEQKADALGIKKLTIEELKKILN